MEAYTDSVKFTSVIFELLTISGNKPFIPLSILTINSLTLIHFHFWNKRRRQSNRKYTLKLSIVNVAFLSTLMNYRYFSALSIPTAVSVTSAIHSGRFETLKITPRCQRFPEDQRGDLSIHHFGISWTIIALCPMFHFNIESFTYIQFEKRIL